MKKDAQILKSMTPLISVVTVVRNGRDVIEQTIQSVLNQQYESIEYIIVDGGSTDGTSDIIKKYEDKLAYWVSEPDKGIYDAMNKALAHVHGVGHIFLNAGDYFVADVFGPRPQIPSFIPVFYRRFLSTRERRQNVRDYRQGMPYCHQGILFESKGIRFNASYRFSADYQYYLDHGYRQGLLFTAAPGHVHYENTGLSMQHATERDKELADIIRRRFGKFHSARFQARAFIKRTIKGVVRASAFRSGRKFQQ